MDAKVSPLSFAPENQNGNTCNFQVSVSPLHGSVWGTELSWNCGSATLPCEDRDRCRTGKRQPNLATLARCRAASMGASPCSGTSTPKVRGTTYSCSGCYWWWCCLEGSHFRPHCRWERPPKAKPWLGDLRIHDRRSVLATLALPLDTGVDRKILHDPRRLLTPRIRSLDRLLALEDQRELRQKIGLWHSAFLSLALNLLAGLQSTNCWHKRSTH